MSSEKIFPEASASEMNDIVILNAGQSKAKHIKLHLQINKYVKIVKTKRLNGQD